MAYDIFQNEKEVIEKAEELLKAENAIDKAAFNALLDDYKKLSKTTHRLIRLSDLNETKLREASAEIVRQKEELMRTQTHLIKKEKLASLGELVAGVAHELNTPLGILLTASTSLGSQARDLDALFKSKQVRKSDVVQFLTHALEACRLVETHSKNASELIKSFMSVSVDRTQDEARDINLSAYSADILRSLEPRFKGKNIRLQLDAPPNLFVHIWPGAYNQVITNLVLNALKHGFEEADTTGEIHVKLISDPEKVHIQITDNGQGIPEAFQDKIFDPFTTTARDKGGTGLGLHIVHNLVVGRLGGDIHVQSIPQRVGTCFTLTLPLSSKKEGIETEGNA